MNKHTIVATAIVASCFLPLTAHAFLGEIIGVGINVGSKLIGAGIDKAKDAMRDHEAEAKKKKEEQDKQLLAYNASIDAIEGKTDMGHLQKEKAVMRVNKQFEMVQGIARLQEQAAAMRRAENDKLFTAGGLLGVVGDAAAGAAGTRMALAQADVMVKAGIPQMQTKAAFARLDATDMGALQARSRSVVAGVDAVVKQGAALLPTAQGAMPAVEQAANALAQMQPADVLPVGAAATAQATEVGDSGTATPASGAAHIAVVANAFTPDLGLKIGLAFEGAPKKLRDIKAALSAQGHQLVEDLNLADVVYRFEGDYVVKENKQHSGIEKNLGSILDDDAFAWSPEKKMLGGIGSSLGKVFMAVAQSQGKNVQLPEAPAMEQTVVLLVAREPKDGKSSRISAISVVRNDQAMPKELAKRAYDELMGKLGLSGT